MEYKNFKIETILELILNLPCSNIYERYELIEYVTGENILLKVDLSKYSNVVREHLIRIYPILGIIEYNEEEFNSLEKYFKQQKMYFGDFLMVSSLSKYYEEVCDKQSGSSLINK